jgi:hypothetical protein
MKYYIFVLVVLLNQSWFAQGLIFNKEKYKQVDKWEGSKKLGFTSSKFPSNLSYRAYCPHVGYQGKESTCVGWSVAYGALSIQLNIQMGITDIYHKWARAFDPNFVYSFLRKKNDRWCEMGTNPEDALKVLQKYGCKPYIWAPWLKCNDNNVVRDTFQLLVAAQYRIENYYRLNNNDIVNDAKLALIDSLPIIIGIGLKDSSMTASTWKNGRWNLGTTDSTTGGHGMCVIGYDDNKFGGSFEVLNSWGEDWGEKGFIWVTYTDFAKYVDQAYVMKTTYYKKSDCSFGDCKNSYSRFKSNNGDIYEGQMTNGKPDVYGALLYKDGSLYVGDWNDGKIHGYGLLFDSKSRIFYNTLFKNGELQSAEEKTLGFADKKNIESKANIDELMNSLPKNTKTVKDFKIANKALSKYEN